MDAGPELSEKVKRKILRKQNRCKNILLKHECLEAVDEPSKYVFVGNGGLVCGIQREQLMELFGGYGLVEDIIMIPDKPYSFVIYDSEACSSLAVAQLNGYKFKPENGCALYLSYVKDVPSKSLPNYTLPHGLLLIPEYITEEEELLFLNSVKFSDDKGIMKHRQVKHYGYEFNYSNNNVDKNKPLDESIPGIFLTFLERLLALGHISRIPDQLTVNQYLPGQGIPPHIDTHSAFEDEIVSLSLGSQVVMDFYAPWNEHVPVQLPRRSLLVMKGESRYLWKHGITPRKTDVVPVFKENASHLTLGHRTTRTSFTFRQIRKGACTCEFADQCDSQSISSNERSPVNDVTEQQAKELENLYVTKVYDNIADHFSETRHKPWPKVLEFINGIPVGSIVIDAGCGNGKNMGRNKSCYQVGCDASVNLANVCMKRKLQVVVCDVLNMPFRDECADVCLCIAVIHHMCTKARRLEAVKEIVRVLSPGGRALIYVWALEQETPEGPSNYLNYKKMTKLCANEENKLKKQNDGLSQANTAASSDQGNVFKMPVHENRTHFRNQDLLVPWHKKLATTAGTQNTKETLYHRYYHVFVKGELESLTKECDVEIVESYYDKGNWCVQLRKLLK